MNNAVKVVVGLSPGIKNILEKESGNHSIDGFTTDDIEQMMAITLHHTDDSKFISFEPNTEFTFVTDGNHNVLGKIPKPIPERMWFIQEEQTQNAEEFVIMALLPTEY